jgi:hypothetical protein
MSSRSPRADPFFFSHEQNPGLPGFFISGAQNPFSQGNPRPIAGIFSPQCLKIVIFSLFRACPPIGWVHSLALCD